jgi:hypothetical protein
MRILGWGFVLGIMVLAMVQVVKAVPELAMQIRITNDQITVHQDGVPCDRAAFFFLNGEFYGGCLP